MEFLKENWFRLSIVLIILGTGFSIAYYFLSYIPQKNTERETNELVATMEAQRLKERQDKRDYIAKRKKDCFDIYDNEKNNWNNTRGSEYDPDSDVCYVIYSSENEWKGIKCADLSPTNGDNPPPVNSTPWKFMMNNLNDCLNKQFRKEF